MFSRASVFSTLSTSPVAMAKEQQGLTATLLKSLQELICFYVLSLVYVSGDANCQQMTILAFNLYHSDKTLVKKEDQVPAWKMLTTGQAPFDTPSVYTYVEGDKVLGTTLFAFPRLKEVRVNDLTSRALLKGSKPPKPNTTALMAVERASLTNPNDRISGKTILAKGNDVLKHAKKMAGHWKVRRTYI